MAVGSMRKQALQFQARFVVNSPAYSILLASGPIQQSCTGFPPWLCNRDVLASTSSANSCVLLSTAIGWTSEMF